MAAQNGYLWTNIDYSFRKIHYQFYGNSLKSGVNRPRFHTSAIATALCV